MPTAERLDNYYSWFREIQVDGKQTSIEVIDLSGKISQADRRDVALIITASNSSPIELKSMNDWIDQVVKRLEGFGLNSNRAGEILQSVLENVVAENVNSQNLDQIKNSIEISFDNIQFGFMQNGAPILGILFNPATGSNQTEGIFVITSLVESDFTPGVREKRKGTLLGLDPYKHLGQNPLYSAA